ncbi:hypothetical protein DB31_1807 [Hyalangium minutum]|uniref:Uncharacterized protein n=1 Tax=Hyalangium minutum TaxID=394096 RepID=A0A085WAS6_9BACT|nr:hypothetical protein DB31_1807 [Hyalangium minutum]
MLRGGGDGHCVSGPPGRGDVAGVPTTHGTRATIGKAPRVQ